MRKVICIGLLVTGCISTGCGSSELFTSHVKVFDSIRAGQGELTQRMPIDSSSVHFSGQGINPGIVFEAAIIYRVSAYYTGLAGQFSGAAQGTGEKILTPEQQKSLLRMWHDTSMSEVERREQIQEFLRDILKENVQPDLPTLDPALSEEPVEPVSS